MLWTTYGLLLCICGIIFNYLWNKRKWYYLSWYMKGPIALPFIGNALLFLNSSSDTMNVISKLCQKYGSPARFWLGSKFLVCINLPTDMETVINAEIQDKGDVYDTISTIIGGHGLLSLNGGAWKIHRKLLNPTVQHYNILNSFNPSFKDKINILINKLVERNGRGNFNIYEYIEAAAADMVCNTTFGMDMKLQQDQNKNFFKAVNDATFLSSLKTLEPWYQYKVVMMFSKYNDISNKCTATIKEFVKKIYDRKLLEHKKNKSDKEIVTSADEFGSKRIRNFIDECIRLTINEKCFNENDSINESITMLLAGFETTAVTVSNVIAMLAMHPEYQEKVYEEIKSVLPPGQTILTANYINQLHYTDRLVKETLRLFPTIPIITRITRSDMKIGGHDIPIGTEVILSIFDLHRLPSIWGPNANKFDPNNFLPENVAQRYSHSYAPFAYGTRNCIGLRYANIVVRLIVASLVQNFVFSTQISYEQLKIKWAITLKLDNGYVVNLKKRSETFESNCSQL